jgi:TRAP-type mannitol/chloroaromatic compound transport system, large permease component
MDATTYFLLAALLALVFIGVEIAICLGTISILALMISTADAEVTLNFLGSTGYEVLRDYLFAVIPLFILMGAFIARSGAASDLFWAVDRGLKRLPGRLAHATVVGNVLFGFVTGTSLAAATTFTSIAYPQMKRYGYSQTFPLGLIAGSACLGMLIPPSLLLVIWAILTDQSIGQLFLAGILPGFSLAALMILYIVAVSIVRPDVVGHGTSEHVTQRKDSAQRAGGGHKTPSATDLCISGVGFVAIILGALVGIWLGIFTPTEGAGIGALIALVLGIVKGMRWNDIQEAVLETARSATPILAIVFAAQLYSRTLAMSGIGRTIEAAMLGTGFGVVGIVLMMISIWFVLGMLIDSISIMLLTVPIFAPVATSLNLDPMVFAMVGVLTIEAGLLTPPFGINVYAVRSVANEPGVTMGAIFQHVTPYWIMLLLLVPLMFAFPAIVTFLPRAF